MRTCGASGRTPLYCVCLCSMSTSTRGRPQSLSSRSDHEQSEQLQRHDGAHGFSHRGDLCVLFAQPGAFGHGDVTSAVAPPHGRARAAGREFAHGPVAHPDREALRLARKHLCKRLFIDRFKQAQHLCRRVVHAAEVAARQAFPCHCLPHERREPERHAHPCAETHPKQPPQKPQHGLHSGAGDRAKHKLVTVFPDPRALVGRCDEQRRLGRDCSSSLTSVKVSIRTPPDDAFVLCADPEPEVGFRAGRRGTRSLSAAAPASCRMAPANSECVSKLYSPAPSSAADTRSTVTVRGPPAASAQLVKSSAPRISSCFTPEKINSGGSEQLQHARAAAEQRVRAHDDPVDSFEKRKE